MRDDPLPSTAAAGPVSWSQQMQTSGLPRAEARMLMEQASGRRREWLIAHGDEPVEAAARGCFDRLAERRRAGEPMAYLLGIREFHGRPFAVGPEVLIPRPETEALCDRIIALAPHGGRVCDLGTGSGVIAVTVAAERPDLRLVATDLSEAALRRARDNAARLLEADAARLALHAGDWWAALPNGSRFDLIAANPPYIAADDPHLERGDLRFEPTAALTDHGDGLGAIRLLVAGAPDHLLPGGWLLMEHGHDQATAVQGLLQAHGFDAVFTDDDLAGLPRITGGRLAAPAAPAPPAAPSQTAGPSAAPGPAD